MSGLNITKYIFFSDSQYGCSAQEINSAGPGSFKSSSEGPDSLLKVYFKKTETFISEDKFSGYKTGELVLKPEP